MATAPNTSFIPKKGPVKRTRQAASKQVHLFTIFSYLFFSATLIATVAVFFYGRYIEELRRQEISALDIAVSSFNDTEMKRVLEFDSRLRQTKQRLTHAVSAVSVLEALEAATVQSARITSLDIERQQDDNFDLKAEIEATTFDAGLFQRGIYERNSVVDKVTIKDLQMLKAGAEEGGGGTSGVKFTAELSVPLAAVPYEPVSTMIVPTSASLPVATTSPTSSSASIISSEENDI